MARNSQHPLDLGFASWAEVRRLTRAVLADAAERIDTCTHRQAATELAWVTRSKARSPFAFDEICLLHGMSADILRKELVPVYRGRFGSGG